MTDVNKLDQSQQRALAAKLFPWHKNFILNKGNCTLDIIGVLYDSRVRTLGAIVGQEIPEEWAYLWARDIGDCDVMMPFITSGQCAYQWALNIGDRDKMVPLITESKWMHFWESDKDEPGAWFINRNTQRGAGI